MSYTDQYDVQVAGRPVYRSAVWLSHKRTNRAILIAGVLAAAVAGFSTTSTHDAAQAATVAGPDLVRLLRGMAVIKSMMALAAAGVVLWRLTAPASLGRLAAYTASCAAMAVGPGLIWEMAHVGMGALLLHGGLACAALLLWRDPAMPVLLAETVRKKALLF